MSFSHIATVSAFNAAQGATLDAGSAINIAANDLIVTLFLGGGGNAGGFRTTRDRHCQLRRTAGDACGRGDRRRYSGGVPAAPASGATAGRAHDAGHA